MLRTCELETSISVYHASISICHKDFFSVWLKTIKMYIIPHSTSMFYAQVGTFDLNLPVKKQTPIHSRKCRLSCLSVKSKYAQCTCMSAILHTICTPYIQLHSPPINSTLLSLFTSCESISPLPLSEYLFYCSHLGCSSM